MTAENPSVSVFAAQGENYFRRWRVTLQFRDRLVGGVPNDPDLIDGWIRTKAGVTDDEEVRQMLLRTLHDLGVDISDDLSYEDIVAASRAVIDVKMNVFKRDDHGLYIEGRQVKAMIKENANIVFAGASMGPTAKRAKGFIAERVFVDEDRIYLGREAADGVHQGTGHVTGPQGPRAILKRNEYVERPRLTFHLQEAVQRFGTEKVEGKRTGRIKPLTEDTLGAPEWAMLWLSAQENGLGADRSQGYGRFDVVEWYDESAATEDDELIAAK